MSKPTLIARSFKNGSALTTYGASANEDPCQIYTVNLTKQPNSGLGFLIRQRDQKPFFSVWEIIENGSAYKSGKIKKGDVILKVNQYDLTAIDYEKGLDILKSITPGTTVSLMLKSGIDMEALQYDKMMNSEKNLKTTKPYASPIQKLKRRISKFTSSNQKLSNENGLTVHSKEHHSLPSLAGNSINMMESKDEILNKIHVEEVKSNLNENFSNNSSTTQQLSVVSRKISSSELKQIKSIPIKIENEKNENIIKEPVQVTPLKLSITENQVNFKNSECVNQSNALNSLQTEIFKEKTSDQNLIKINDRLQVNEEHASNNKNDKIKIVQIGDEICINIGENIEIFTNITNDRKVISLSPQVNRKVSNKQKKISLPPESLNQKSNEIIDQKKKTMLKQKAISNDSQVNGIDHKTFKSLNISPQELTSEEVHACPIDERKKLPTTPLTSAKEISPRKVLKKKGSKIKYLIDQSSYIDTLHHKTFKKITCNSDRCTASLLQDTRAKDKKTKDEIIEEAVDFINQFYASVKREDSKTHKERVDEIIRSINETGTYELKETELCFGARTAWRNAPRCIGRIQWSKLQVFDARYVTTARGMFECICNHLKYGYNKGNIRSAITIFRQRTDECHDFRVWNSQFLSYAGYKIDDKTIIGDRNQIELTEICIKMGWKPKYTEFDILPLVLQANGQDPELFEIPSDLTVSLDLTHPKYDWFKELNLKWYCVPGVSSMMLDVGGIEFTACPFNGWYMGTEIGRDLADINRYNKLPIIAEKMGLDTKTNISLWKDKALIELNYAVLYSFQKAGVTITDHHSASESFMKHHENENQIRGGCPADWIWVVPPLSSHLTPVFHLEMLNYALKPSYEYQEPPWTTHVWKQKHSSEDKNKRTRRKVYFSDIARAVKFSAKLMGKALAKRVKCTILYATETGKSERFAKNLAEIFKHSFDAKCLCMRDYDVVDLGHETLLLLVSSTFGNGDPPENGEEFKKTLFEMKKDQNLSERQSSFDKGLMYENNGTLTNVRFAVFGLGNSSYPKFCSFAKFLDSSFGELGAERIHQVGIGDELCGQEESFRKWSVSVYKSAVETFCIDTDTSFIDSISDDLSWSSQTVRLTIFDEKKSLNLCENLSKLHNRKILPCKLNNKRNLQHEKSGRVTLNIELNMQGYAGELEYKPGDHVGIIAANRKELVDAILTKVSNAPPSDQLVKVEILKEKTTVFGVTKQWIVDERFPTSSLRSSLTNYLDITSPVSQNMLLYFASQATNENDRLQLEKLAKDHLAYEEWKNSIPNLVELLDEFPSLKPNASLLVTQLPKLQPRFYSISSSSKATADDIHVTAGIVEYKPKGKSMHYGVCTKWLDELPIGEIVPAFVRGAPSFRLPDDKTLPIIMVGAGTGIAPFRSFWQERKIDMEMMPIPTGVNGNRWGEVVLYFGCRQFGLDELYRNEIDELIKDNVITSYYAAYSREPNSKKTYVQDLISKNFSSIHDLIFNKKGHIYICGDVKMAAEVTNVIEIGLKEKCKISLDEAKDYVNDMRETLRFHEDIFGNSSNIVQNH